MRWINLTFRSNTKTFIFEIDRVSRSKICLVLFVICSENHAVNKGQRVPKWHPLEVNMVPITVKLQIKTHLIDVRTKFVGTQFEGKQQNYAQGWGLISGFTIFFRVSSNWICSGLWHLSPRKFHDTKPMIHKVYLTFSCHESTHNRLTKNLNSKTNIQQRYDQRDRDRHKKKIETNFNFSWSINTI